MLRTCIGADVSNDYVSPAQQRPLLLPFALPPCVCTALPKPLEAIPREPKNQRLRNLAPRLAHRWVVILLLACV